VAGGTRTSDAEWQGLSELRDSIIRLVADYAYERREEPFPLSQGYLSHDYIDAKKALSNFERAVQVGEAVLELVVDEARLDFDAVGGMAFGAAPMAFGVSAASTNRDRARDYFTVLKEEKPHGKKQQIVGVDLQPGTPILLVDDVATTGQSLVDALAVLESLRVEVVMAVTLVDRGDTTRERFKELGIPYEPVVTYRDLGIAPVPDTRVSISG
jgi:orotate phosphoribosyltransferase